MKRTRKWHKKLTIKELKHLQDDANVTTLRGLKTTFDFHAEMRKRGGSDPCWTCRTIAIKLGFPV
jgi:hypothetical protein